MFRTNQYSLFIIILTLLILFSCNKDELEPIPPIIPPITQFTVNITYDGQGGTIKKENIGNGQTVKITAIPNKHFQLTDWTGDCGTFEQDNLEIIFTPSKNCQLGVEFEKIIYKITATSTQGGQIYHPESVLEKKSSKKVQVSHLVGEEVVIEAIPEQGYKFIGWTTKPVTGNNSETDQYSCPEIKNSSEPKLTFVVQGNCHLEATFEQAVRTITIIPSQGGTIEISSSEKGNQENPFSQGDTIEITATADKHYYFNNWEGTCGEFDDKLTKLPSADSSVSFTIDEDCTIKGVFTLITYEIVGSATLGGTIDEPNTITAHYGKKISFKAIPQENYTLSQWKTNDTGCPDLTDKTNETINLMVIGNCSLQAIFEKIIDNETNIDQTTKNDENTSETSETTDDKETELTPSTNIYSSNTPTNSDNTKKEETTKDTTNDDINKNNQDITDNGDEDINDQLYTIQATASPGGQIQYPQTLSKKKGQAAEFVAISDNGYRFTSWDLTGCPELSSINDSPFDSTYSIANFKVVRDCSLHANFQLLTYTITTESNDGGQVTTFSEKVPHGQEVEITATPDTYYKIKRWGGTCGEFSPNEQTISFRATKDCTLNVHFETPQYTIKISSTDGGSTTPSGTISKTSGEEIRLTTKANDGYSFGNWKRLSSGCAPLSDFSYPQITIPVIGDCHIQASFLKVPRTITTSAGNGGTITESQKVEHGESVSITATADVGYKIASWSGSCGVFNKSTNPIIFQAIKDCSINVSFEKKVYGITTSAGDGGTISENQKVKHGESVSIIATPNTDYQIASWSGTCGTYTKSTNPVSITASKDCSISVAFEKVSYTITTTAGIGGTITGNQSVKHGESVSITATPSTGYQIASWSGTCGTYTKSTNPVSITASKSCSISVAFEKVAYTITTTAGTGGTITGNQSVKHGESVSITATPSTGYQVQSWGGTCGTYTKSTNPISITATKDCSISVAFEKVSYTITTNAGTGGSITGNQSVKHGESVSITATPSTGYQVQSWGGTCGTYNKNTNPVSFTATKDCSISVSFEKVTHTITTNAGTGGTITGNQSVQHGESVSITATPSTGYQIASWTGTCGTYNKNTNPVSITATKDCSISVSFETDNNSPPIDNSGDISYTITTSAGTGGSITENQTVEQGESVSITATPSAGYQVQSWGGTCGTYNKNTNPVSFTPTQSCTISVAFEKVSYTITTNAGTGGSITGNQSVKHGESVSITALPSTGYQIASWSGTCGTYAKSANPVSITATKDCLISVAFEKVSYTITTNAGTGGSITGNQSVKHGESVSITATLSTGYQIQSWSGSCGTFTSSTNPATFTATKDCAINVAFEKVSYSITTTAGTGGTITGNQSVKHGESVSITALPSTGYQVQSWGGTCGSFDKSTNPATFTATKDCSISITFEKVSYSITTTAGTGGTITQNQSAEHGTTVSITATPSTGYQIASWSGNCGTFTKSTNPATFTATKDCSISVSFEKVSYTITTNADTGGEITENQSVKHGESVSITATPSTGYQIQSWSGTCGTYSKSTNPVSVTATKDCSISVAFEKVSYTITTTAGTGGTITGNQSVKHGESVSITATPSTSYQIQSWSGNCGTFTKSTNPATFTASKNCSISVSFEQKTVKKISYTITTSAGTGGSITQNQIAEDGETVRITATPSTGYQIASWSGTCGTFSQSTNPATFTASKNCSISVSFEKVTYTITTNAGDGGSITEDQSVKHDESVSITATPSAGYQIASWSGNCGTFSQSTNPATFTATKDCSINVAFEKVPYTITTNSGDGGSITENQSVKHGDNVSITATPSAGYQIASWSGNCGTFSQSTNPATFTATKDCSINVAFEKVPYTITTNSGDGGSITENQSVKHGDNVSITATPSSGYQIASWSGNCGAFSQSTNPATFTATKDCSISVAFEKVPYTITTNSGDGGSITENQSVKHGDNVSITATPSEGYQIASWSGNCGTFTKSTNPATFTATKDCSISVAFEKKSYTITTNAGTGGTITGNQSVQHGESVSITATPSTSYQIQSWSGTCGTYSKSTNPVSITATKDCSISVAFEKVSYTITTNAGAGGTITENQSVKHGESVSITATPSTSYQIQSWSGNCGTFTKSTNPATFTASKNCSISVSFELKTIEKISYTITTSAGTGGSITQNQRAEDGETVRITATPDTGYQITSWSGSCGTFTSSTNPATFTATKNCSISVSFEKVTYTITTNAGIGGTITENQSAEHGESVSITATPSTGYQIASWSGSCGTFTSSTNPATFTATKDCAINVAFEKKTYTITTNANDGGTITENQSVKHGEFISITATPNAGYGGYELKSMKSNCGRFSKNGNTITFTVTKKCYVRAKFQKIIHTITTSAGEGGSIIKDIKVVARARVFITATADTGYQIASWSGDCGTFNKETNPARFIATKNCSISVAFEKIPYLITTSAGDGGTITQNQNVVHGESVSISATPNAGYQISSWSGNCGTFSKSINTATFTASKNCSISVSFEKLSYTITTSAGDGGSITSNQNVNHGESVSISATPNTGYQIASWSGNCGTFEKSTSIVRFTASKNCSVSVSFEKSSYTISTSSGDGGSITSNQNVNHGESVSISATPNTGYQIASWSGNCGTFEKSTSIVRFTASKNCSVSVSFEKSSYTISTSAGNGGTITSNQNVQHGESASISATPNTGYQIASWSGNCGNFDQSTNPVSFTASKNCSISVSFEKTSYTITTSAGNGGTITPNQNIKDGESVSITAKPNTGYQIASWSGNCGNFDQSTNPVSFTASKNCSISVSFEKTSYTITTSTGNGGTITPNQNVIHGESVNITATPNDKYQIKAWSGTCGTFSKSTNTATFTASKSCSLSVSFEKVSYTINTNAGTGGSITPNQNVQDGESVSITAKPNTGYQIASWSGNCGTFSSSDNPVRFTASKNCSINVNFEKLSYTITTSASDGGTISAGIESVEHGQSVSITATPSTNYEISSWSGSCGNFSNNRETIQFTATKSCSVGVHFDKVKYFVFTVSDIGGTITASKYIKHGEQFTVTAYPKPDSTIYKWTGDCGTFSRLSNSVTITVTSTCYLGVRWLIPSENFIELDSNGVTIKVKSGLSQRDVVGREGWIDYGGENGVVDYLIVNDFMLKQRISQGKSVDKIVTTYVTNMNGLFRNKYLFNEDISTWDTSNVISMNSMFNQASAFNRDIGNWDVSKVIDMRNMFREAHNFNQNIGGWNVSNVTLMNGMFSNYDEGGRFNQDISTWNVSNVTDMNSMFNGSTNFNQNLSGWNVTNVVSCASFSSNSKLADNHKPRFTNCEE